MQGLINFFHKVNTTYWGDSFFRYAFYISIVTNLCLGKNKFVKTYYAVYPIVFIGLIYSPIGYQISKFFFHGMWEYYCRLYSLIPVLYCIALGIVLLLDKSKGLLKFGFVMVVCSFIVLRGEFIYNQNWMNKAENLCKIPTAVIRISEFIHEYDYQETIKIVFPESLSAYARQYDSSFITPYGRIWGNDSTLSRQIGGEKQDVSLVLSEAGIVGCDYVVTYDWPNIRQAWSHEGFEPVFNSRGYDVYDIHKNAKIKKILNNKRQIIRELYVDAEGGPRKVDTGWCIVQFEYDVFGHIVKIKYTDSVGNLVNTSGGYAISELFYDKWRYTGNKLFDKEGIQL